MSHQSIRMFRISTMKSNIKAAMLAGAELDKDKFISECCLNFGAGRRYVLEYLRDLINSNFIVEKDGKLYTPEALKIENMLQSSKDNSPAVPNQRSAEPSGQDTPGELMTSPTDGCDEEKQ